MKTQNCYSAIMGHIDTATAGLWSCFVKPVQFTIYNNQLPSPSQTFNRYITLSQEAVYSQADVSHIIFMIDTQLIIIQKGKYTFYYHFVIEARTIDHIKIETDVSDGTIMHEVSLRCCLS